MTKQKEQKKQTENAQTIEALRSGFAQARARLAAKSAAKRRFIQRFGNKS